MKKLAVGLCVLTGMAAGVSAVEAIPRGQLQLQATYHDPKIGDDARWSIAMPNNYVGVTAVEQLPNGAFMGHWQAGIDPLAETDTVVLTHQQAFLNWRQGVFSLWGGRLPSLEQAFLEESYAGHLSLSAKGLAASQYYPAAENKAARVDVSSGEYLVFSGQWIIDETLQDLRWSAAAAVQAPEGSFALTYRKNDDAAAIWGNRISWQSDNIVLSGVWLYQEAFLGWDVEARFLAPSVESFIAYGHDETDGNRWSLGVHQKLTPTMTNYSEIIRWSDLEQWRWSTGFQLKF